MALSIVNNNASLNAQQSLNRTNSSLSKSLERLSSGLKVNRGADGPAALVISEQQRAQIAGLKTAIDNTNKAVSVVQTAEGALNEVNGLLTKIRGLALDSANSGVNDSNALAANQAEITNSLNTITSIANTTKFGTKNLLNGQAGVTASVTGANNAGLGSLTGGVNAAAGAVTVAVTTQGTGGTAIGAGGTGAAIGASGGSVVLSGGGLTTGQSLTVALSQGDTTASARTKIQSALDNAASIGGGAGKFVVTQNGNNLEIRSNILGSAAVTAISDAAGTAATTGFAVGAGTTGAAGVGLVVTVGGASTSVSAGSNGLNNQVSFGGAEGINFTVNVANGVTVAAGAGSNTTVSVNDQKLTFQIGANANETAVVSIDQVTTDRLGSGVLGVSAANLSAINVTSQAGAQDAIKVVDAAISQVSNLRGKLGAFQSNTLESNARNLSATLENTTAAESVIRDTDFATEIANFTRLQTQIQAGSTVLGNANQTTQLVAQLLRG
jgi:flagellin